MNISHHLLHFLWLSNTSKSYMAIHKDVFVYLIFHIWQNCTYDLARRLHSKIAQAFVTTTWRTSLKLFLQWWFYLTSKWLRINGKKVLLQQLSVFNYFSFMDFPKNIFLFLRDPGMKENLVFLNKRSFFKAYSFTVSILLRHSHLQVPRIHILPHQDPGILGFK